MKSPFPNPSIMQQLPLQAKLLSLLACFLALCNGFRCRGADANEEQQLIAVLGSAASPQEKDAACARLKRIGTRQSVPALATLLTDEQLSHSARYALESMSIPQAGGCLREALEKTTGAIRVGIIDSLGVRRETKAVPELIKLLSASDLDTSCAAAAALGNIGTEDAVSALVSKTKVPADNDAVHQATVDALLRCANQEIHAGKSDSAYPLFQQLYENEKAGGIRIAAYRGMVLSAPRQSVELITKGLLGPSGPAQLAALQLVHDVPAEGITEAIEESLPKTGPAMQAALIDALSQRGNPAAAPAIAALAKSPDSQVRIAVFHALGWLGDAHLVTLLAQAAAESTGPEQAAAREALAQINRGEVADAMLSQLENAAPPVQAELARALGTRTDTAAVPRLLELAKRGNDSARKACLQALAELVNQAQIGELVDLLVGATDASAHAHAQVAEALNSACQHILAKSGRVDLTPLLHGLSNPSPDVKVFLLPICSEFNEPEVCQALRTAMSDSDSRVREAAVRALCDTTDAELLPDLLSNACYSPDSALRSLAVAGCVRLSTQEESVKLSNEKKLETLKAMLDASPAIDEKKMVIAGLANVPTVETLKLLQGMLAQDAVHVEAARAIIKATPGVPETEAATTALNAVLSAFHDSSIDQAAQVALKEVQAGAGFITAWQVAGPYSQAGKDYSELFNIAFPPESNQNQGPGWKLLSCNTDSKRPWVMDLAKDLGGQECVAYARVWLQSPAKQNARLEVGSDDGVKIWLNKKLVHANNTARALRPGSDKMNIELNRGWNQLVLKVTQHNAGWAFCARLVNPDGAPLEALQFTTADPVNH